MLAAAAVAAAPAAAIVRPVAPSADRVQQRPYFDVRAHTRQELHRRGVATLRRPSAATRGARTDLRRSLGRRAYLSVDPLTGTPRVFTRLDGTLDGPARGSARDVAWRYARSNAAALGLSESDFATFREPDVRTSPSGITTVRWRQFAGGIPAYDNGLRVNLGRGNRVVSVQGSPVSGLDLGSTEPKLSAEAALDAFMANVGVRRAVRVTSRSTGARRETRFSTGDRARLVIFHTAGGDRLAWSLTYRAASAAWYEGVVDAASGRVLRRTNLTKQVVAAQVFDNYPGAPVGGTRRLVDLEPYLDPAATTLSGPFARTYLDVNDDDEAQAGEEVVPGLTTFTPFTPDGGFCQPTKLCSWDPADRTSWEDNKEHEAVQAHWFVSRFHDHLERPPIGFTDSSGNFEVDDPVEVNGNDGAATGAGGGPDTSHVDNANMSTLPDGQSPRMQMYLFEPLDIAPDPGPEVKFRAMNGDDSADILYHEYTHGLSNRLVVNDEGFGALSSPHAGAMGEGWSDWYAKDLLAREGFQPDVSTVEGEVDMGIYTDGEPHFLRREGLDCPVGGDPDACPGGVDADDNGSPDTGTGGFTLGDFGVIGGGAEVHDDGEIWAQTLWDLRKALITQEGTETAGSDLAEQLVTDGMRLSPVEPTFLDMRNSILAADEAANGGANAGLIWTVFAARGMGYFAGAVDGGDVAPAEDFAQPPAPGGPTGTIAGTVTDASSGLPVAGERVGIAGHTTDPGFGDYFVDETGPDGTYSIAGVPAGTYPKLAFLPAAGYDAEVHGSVTVPAGGTATQDAAVRRDWAASSGGALIESNDDSAAPFGCGHDPLIDQTLGLGWSPFQAQAPANQGNPHFGAPPAATIELPQAIDITAFGMDPGATCGDDETATTRLYRVETSRDGVSFAVAKAGEFTVEDAGRLNIVAPDANAAGVRFVRLTLLEPIGEGPTDAGRLFVDFSELEVFGGPPNTLPHGALSGPQGPVQPGQAFTLRAAFTDGDSRITGYDWDFDANGTVDRTTGAPETTHAYGTPGTYSPRVTAKDFRGGGGTASTSVVVAGGTPPPPPGPGPGAERPRFSLPASGRKGRARFVVTCDSACSGAARLIIGRSTARKLGLSGRQRGRARVRLPAAGRRRITIRLSRTTLRAMRRENVRSIKLRLTVAVTDAEGQRRTSSRTVRIRRT